MTGQSRKPSFNPLGRRSERALERSSRLAGMQTEKEALEARLRALEAESASLSKQIMERESEWRSLTESCLDYETAASELERDLKVLSYE